LISHEYESISNQLRPRPELYQKLTNDLDPPSKRRDPSLCL
jgi:hypothetical protein